MQKFLKKAVEWLADMLAAKITEKFDAIDKRLDRLEGLHEQDAVALEADLAMMDDRICTMIGICRKRRYTTADERRRVTRLHDAYKARGGNHGEENEYAIFLTLPTEEEYQQQKGEYNEEY